MSPTRVGRLMAEVMDAPRRWLDGPLRSRMTHYGYFVLDGDYEPAIEPMRATPAFAEIRSRMLANPPHPNDTRQGGLLWTRSRSDRAPAVRRQ